MARREAELVAAFVQLADTLVDDYDSSDLIQYLLDRAVELLPADAGAVLLADERGELQVFASTDETAAGLELLQLQSRNGPCLQAYRTGERVLSEDLAADGERWPEFTAAAHAQGFRSVYALPLRLREERLGAMNLFGTAGSGTLSGDDLAVGRALADIASIGLLQARMLADHKSVNSQLQRALGSRIVIEQAKGVLSAQGDLHPETAFEALRGYARHHRRRLPDLARAIVERGVDAAEVLAFSPVSHGGNGHRAGIGRDGHNSDGNGHEGNGHGRDGRARDGRGSRLGR